MTTKLLTIPGMALALVIAGCGGAQSPTAEVIKPAAATPAAGEGAAASGTTGATGTEGAATKPATPALSPTALGPQIKDGYVRFNYKPDRAPRKLYLAGNFNDWNPSNDDFLLSDDDGDGIYSILIKLQPGTYQYKFVIDGNWTKDPRSPAAHDDGFGGLNGKFQVP